MISRNEIKTRVKANCNYEISKECLDVLCKYVSDFTDKIIVKCIDEFNQINRLREIQKLPKLKRIDKSILINLSDNLFNNTSDFLIGDLGVVPIDKLNLQRQRW